MRIFYRLLKRFNFVNYTKWTDIKKIQVYKAAHQVEGFEELLQRQIQTWMKKIALKAMPGEEIAFLRGAIYGHQQLLNSIKQAHLRANEYNEYAKED